LFQRHHRNGVILWATTDETVLTLQVTKRTAYLQPQCFEFFEWNFWDFCLSYGPLDVLTNGTQITFEKAKRLKEIQSASKNSLRFRVSMEHFEQEKNDSIRGENAYHKAVQGITFLAQAGFSPILTVTRTWEEAKDAAMELEFVKFLQKSGVQQPQIKILPGFLLGQLAKNERDYSKEEFVTEKCFENFDITQLQCATSRMATGEGVYVCPILVDQPNARMGDSIGKTMRPFPLSHSACYTCRVTGMTCKSPS